VHPGPPLAAEEIEHLVAGKGVGPGEKWPGVVELIPLLPQHEAGLLVDVVEFDRLRQERADEGVDLPLVPQEHVDEVVRGGCGAVVGWWWIGRVMGHLWHCLEEKNPRTTPESSDWAESNGPETPVHGKLKTCRHGGG
jgi:hypothetical protein